MRRWFGAAHFADVLPLQIKKFQVALIEGIYAFRLTSSKYAETHSQIARGGATGGGKVCLLGMTEVRGSVREGENPTQI